MVRQAPVICVMAPPIHLGAWSMDNVCSNSYTYANLLFVSGVSHKGCVFSLETPFESGKVFGIWYVGNTVYTVSCITSILCVFDSLCAVYSQW